MRHIDPDVLALLALGETAGSAEERAHATTCPKCADDLAQLGSAVSMARRTIDEPFETPHPRVWAAVATELRLPDPAGVEPPRAARRARPPRRRLLIGVAIAAAVATIGGVAIAGVRSTEVRTVASTELVASAAWAGASGSAVALQMPDGSRLVRVTVLVHPTPGTFHEVWLGTADAKTMVGLGVLHGRTGTFRIPATVSLARYPVVDVSDEPHDGNPANSGNSIVRGSLG